MRGCSCCGSGDACCGCVFPAYAGMFRKRLHQDGGAPGFPRVCGDVPHCPETPKELFKFSPRMRGCSLWTGSMVCLARVFPAYAGMFRANSTLHTAQTCFPRVCGDVPTCTMNFSITPMFSPRMRGCSLFLHHEAGGEVVFPAYAGMFRFRKLCVRLQAGFPRVCGDVPCINNI